MLVLPATLTAREARDTLRLLGQALRHEPEDAVAIDAAGLQHFDSSALAVLLECQRLALGWGKTCQVRRAPPKLGALAALYGIDALLFAPEAPAGEPLATTA